MNFKEVKYFILNLLKLYVNTSNKIHLLSIILCLTITNTTKIISTPLKNKILLLNILNYIKSSFKTKIILTLRINKLFNLRTFLFFQVRKDLEKIVFIMKRNLSTLLLRKKLWNKHHLWCHLRNQRKK